MGNTRWLWWSALAVLLATCRGDSDHAAGVIHNTKGTGTITVTGLGNELPKVVAHGGLSFEIVDAATGKRIPGKLTIVGVKGTPDPRLSRGDIGVEDGTSLSAFNRVF